MFNGVLSCVWQVFDTNEQLKEAMSQRIDPLDDGDDEDLEQELDELMSRQRISTRNGARPRDEMPVVDLCEDPEVSLGTVRRNGHIFVFLQDGRKFAGFIAIHYC